MKRSLGAFTTYSHRDGLCILGGRGVYFRGAAARYLGLLASTLGRGDVAIGHLEHARC